MECGGLLPAFLFRVAIFWVHQTQNNQNCSLRINHLQIAIL